MYQRFLALDVALRQRRCTRIRENFSSHDDRVRAREDDVVTFENFFHRAAPNARANGDSGSKCANRCRGDSHFRVAHDARAVCSRVRSRSSATRFSSYAIRNDAIRPMKIRAKRKTRRVQRDQGLTDDRRAAQHEARDTRWILSRARSAAWQTPRSVPPASRDEQCL